MAIPSDKMNKKKGSV